MNKVVLVLACLCVSIIASAQNEIKIIVKTAAGEPLPGVNISIPTLNKATETDSLGIATFTGVPPGKHKLQITHVGHASIEKELNLPGDGTEFSIEMEEAEEEEEEVVIQSTRSSRTIRDIPTRVEFVAGEELDEKSNMKPGDIRMVLNESTGIMTQQTSATSANASIRIQGLDGRYTQVLKDGFPLYAGFSGGLSLLQTPPLDLKQFEVIKGAASTLYGGGAIAGLVNLISKTPGPEREFRMHLDGTSALGLNTSLYYGKRFGKFGLTYFASRNSNAPYDPSSVGLTAIPKFERYTVNPKLFFYLNDKSQVSAGINFSHENRNGGDIDYIKEKKPTGFFETNVSDRLSSQVAYEKRFGARSHITIKNSLSWFEREIRGVGFIFKGTQYASFTEATYASHGERSEWITGLNFVSDRFKESKKYTANVRDYEQYTAGAFVQNNFKVNEVIHLETGVRGDYVWDYGFAFLPRIAVLFRLSPQLTSRVGGGMGYKTPTIFTEETERLQYRNLFPIDEDFNKLERSYGANADINYKTGFADGDGSFSINHMFFYTRIEDPLMLSPFSTGFRLVNTDGHIDSKGMETNVRVGFHDFKLFLGYTFTEAYLHVNNIKRHAYLTPSHRLNSVLLYEVEEKWKVGLEAYYFSKQQLSDGAFGKSYWVTGFMVEKLWEKFSVYVNFENFLDARQTKFDTIYTGTIANPSFRDIYAPLDGFVVNGGVKLRL